MHTVDELIACAQRELRLRKRVYPGLVNNKKITADRCRYEIQCMESMIAFLKACRRDGTIPGESQAWLGRN